MFEQAKVFGRKAAIEEKVVEPSFDEVEAKPNNKPKFSTTSPFLFREINLFMPETIGMAIAILASVVLVVVGLLFNSSEALMYSAAPPVICLILFWLARFLLFMPNKHRHLTERIMASGAIRFSVDDIKTSEIPFDKSPMSDKVKIINKKKNIDFNTGKPVIVLREGSGENVSLSEQVNTSQQSKELSTVIDSIWGTAEAFTRYNIQKKEANKEMILFIMIGICLVGILGIAWLTLGNGNMLAELVKVIVPVPAK